MSPKKKTKTSTTKSPKDLHFERLDAAMKRAGALGQMLVRGIRRRVEDEEEGDEGDSEAEEGEKYTEEEIATLRHIFITKNRDKELTKAETFVTCGQADDMIRMYNTTTGNQVILGIPREVNKIMRKKTASAKFDGLLGLTYHLKDEDTWMMDNECWGEDGELANALIKLGDAWKELLAKSDSELKIDDGYSRGGVLCLLEQFTKSIESIADEHGCEYSFPYC